MNTTKFIKLLSFLVTAVMLVGTVGLMSVFADETDVSAQYKTGTLLFEDDFNQQKPFEASGYTKYEDTLAVSLTENGMVLTTDASVTGGQIVQLFNYDKAMNDGQAYTIVLKCSMNAEPNLGVAETKNMIGLAYNINQDDPKSYCYASIRSSANYDLNRQLAGTWQKAGQGSTRNRAISFFDYQADEEYEIIVRLYSDNKIRMILDGAVTYEITDNYREGTGIGLYVRQCVATVNYLAVYEDATNSSADNPIVEDFGGDVWIEDDEDDETEPAQSETQPVDTRHDDNADTDGEDANSGCGSFLAVAPLLAVGVVGVTAVGFRKKERK